MARRGGKTTRDIETYAHAGKERANNPPVGLVTPETDRDVGRKTYAHDRHLDPQLVWTGKAEHTSFEVPTVSLHVHERIDPRTIIEAVRKRNGTEPQPSLFAAPEENPPIRQAIEFYKRIGVGPVRTYLSGRLAAISETCLKSESAIAGSSADTSVALNLQWAGLLS